MNSNTNLVSFVLNDTNPILKAIRRFASVSVVAEGIHIFISYFLVGNYELAGLSLAVGLIAGIEKILRDEINKRK